MVLRPDWDYLIVTASGEEQAAAYENQIRLRQHLGLIPGVRNIWVVADPGGHRVGSGGSTLRCLLGVIGRETNHSRPHSLAAWKDILRRLRILIIHAGGDSKRLPPYGPCGKIFVPVPGESDRAVGMTLLDRQLPLYLSLPPPPENKGQVVVTTGDVLLDFDPAEVRFAETGITGVGCRVRPALARGHGVFCSDESGRVRLFLQKPSPDVLRQTGAVDGRGQAVLDIGIMNMDEEAAVRLLGLCRAAVGRDGDLCWTGTMTRAVESCGLDFYRDICCALGTEADEALYQHLARAGGSGLPASILSRIFRHVSPIPFSVRVVSRCGFLHFGTLRQLISSGNDLLRMHSGPADSGSCLDVNNSFAEGGEIAGQRAWVEGCRIRSRLSLGGDNVVVGLDIDQPLDLPRGAGLDVIAGRDRKGGRTWFIRFYGIDDTFNSSEADEASLCGIRLKRWLESAGADPADVWDGRSSGRADIWQARLFPKLPGPSSYRDWLWVYSPQTAGAEQKNKWRNSDRYSLAEIARLASQEAYHGRRLRLRAEAVRRDLDRIFGPRSGFSARELVTVLQSLDPPQLSDWIRSILGEALKRLEIKPRPAGLEQLEFSRIAHSLGSALLILIQSRQAAGRRDLTGIQRSLPASEIRRLEEAGLERDSFRSLSAFARKAREAAFSAIGRTIVRDGSRRRDYPRNALRSDEIIWGRAPARLDLGGGWSDTPPYSLEHGGCVINAAVDLNGQPPIHVYARVIADPVIRIASIDHGARIRITALDELLDYRQPTSRFALAKAALCLSGFSPRTASWPRGIRSLHEMLKRFGGGIELTTLAAIPSGSGLGTSSIMGVVIIDVLNRMMGRKLTPRKLFNTVLQLEQELTTGGGWQDQVGGAAPGAKLIRTGPGLVPDPIIHHLPADVLDPASNGGRTLLYYTGMRRLAKNILRSVVGRYLDRSRPAVDTLREIHAFPPLLAEAMEAKDVDRFGSLIGEAWNLKIKLDPGSTTPVIEDILDRVRPLLSGATILGAGGGGFLLFVCRTAEDARSARQRLEDRPPNDRARFFEFGINREGLTVTVC